MYGHGLIPIFCHPFDVLGEPNGYELMPICCPVSDKPGLISPSRSNWLSSVDIG